MTAQELIDEMKARCEKATPGPWDLEYSGCECEDIQCTHPPFAYKLRHVAVDEINTNDYEFIAHARTDLPRVLKALELALYYIDGDATYRITEDKIRAILSGETE